MSYFPKHVCGRLSVSSSRSGVTPRSISLKMKLLTVLLNAGLAAKLGDVAGNMSLLSAALGSVKPVDLPGVGQVLMKEEDHGDKWALVMKLSKNDFCHGSSRWTDGEAFNADKMLDDSFPNHREYDAKHIAFHKLAGVTAIRLQTQSGSSEVYFEGSGTPEQLITTNDIKISAAGGFNSKTYWDSWQTTFGNARDRAPAFMRADKFVTDPKPECRTDPWNAPSGCGKPCLFCMQAGDGSGCPVARAHNDISSGIGLSASYCGGGDSGDCSTSSNWAGDRRTLVWAKIAGPHALILSVVFFLSNLPRACGSSLAGGRGRNLRFCFHGTLFAHP